MARYYPFVGRELVLLLVVTVVAVASLRQGRPIDFLMNQLTNNMMTMSSSYVWQWQRGREKSLTPLVTWDGYRCVSF